MIWNSFYQSPMTKKHLAESMKEIYNYEVFWMLKFICQAFFLWWQSFFFGNFVSNRNEFNIVNVYILKYCASCYFRKRKSDVACIQKSLSGCPAAIKMKTLHVMDWFNSIGKSVGICNEEPPRKCQPKEAMKCVSMLSEGVMRFGMTKEAPAVCSWVKWNHWQGENADGDLSSMLDKVWSFVNVSFL